MSACIVNNKFIYITGGYAYQDINCMEKYSIKENSYDTIKLIDGYKLPTRITALFSFQIDASSILIAGGFADEL